MRPTVRDTSRQWMLEMAVRGGHRYFLDVVSGRIGIADDSGPTPSTTDDGVLYLDESRPVALTRTRYEFGSDLYALIPVLTDDERYCSTPATLEEGLRVVSRFGLQLYGQHQSQNEETSKEIDRAVRARATIERAVWLAFDRAGS